MALTSASCPTSDERVKLFALLLDVNARLARSFGSILERECAIPLPWFEALMQLHQSPDGRLTMSVIAEAIVHSTGGTTRIIDRMVDEGLVRRESCPEDRRAIYVAIEPAGHTKLHEALAVHVDYLEASVSSRLTCAERESLMALLTKLHD